MCILWGIVCVSLSLSLCSFTRDLRYLVLITVLSILRECIMSSASASLVGVIPLSSLVVVGIYVVVVMLLCRCAFQRYPLL